MSNKQWYIDYFAHMEEEEIKLHLGGMAWDDVMYHAEQAVKQGIFTINELQKRWPALFDWIGEA